MLQYAMMLNDRHTESGYSGFGYSPEEMVDDLALAASRLHEAYRLSNDKPRWADKTPQYIEILDELRRLFGPGARFVMLYRHPYDVIFSTLQRGWFANPGSHDPFGDMLERVAGSLEKQMRFEAAYPDICVRIRYNDLVHDPRRTLEPVLDFLDEPWSDNLLRFREFDHNVGTEDPLIRGTKGFVPSENNWRYWTAAEKERAGNRLKPVLDALGFVG